MSTVSSGARWDHFTELQVQAFILLFSTRGTMNPKPGRGFLMSSFLNARETVADDDHSMADNLPQSSSSTDFRMSLVT